MQIKLVLRLDYTLHLIYVFIEFKLHKKQIAIYLLIFLQCSKWFYFLWRVTL
jgi:hypothetical protein